jgi:drug/metabolite transporter (DMT)-like permease
MLGIIASIMTWLFLALFAALCKSLSVIAEKKVLQTEEAEIYTSQISLWLAIFSLPLLYFVQDFNVSLPILLIIYATSIASLVSALAASHVVQKLDISESSALFALSPIFVSTLAIILLKEILSPFQIIGIVVACIGVVILELHQKTPHTHHPLHFHLPNIHISKPVFSMDNKAGLYLLLFICLIFFAFASITDKYLIFHVGVDPILFLLLVQLFILINFLIIDLLFLKRLAKKQFYIHLLKNKSFLVNIVVIIIHRISHTYAVQLIEISILNAVKQVSAVITTIIGGKIFTEKYIIRRAFACVIIVIGIILIII